MFIFEKGQKKVDKLTPIYETVPISESVFQRFSAAFVSELVWTEFAIFGELPEGLELETRPLGRQKVWVIICGPMLWETAKAKEVILFKAFIISMMKLVKLLS